MRNNNGRNIQEAFKKLSHQRLLYGQGWPMITLECTQCQVTQREEHQLNKGVHRSPRWTSQLLARAPKGTSSISVATSLGALFADGVPLYACTLYIRERYKGLPGQGQNYSWERLKVNRHPVSGMDLGVKIVRLTI